MARQNEVARLLMTAPGVDVLVALAYVSIVGAPAGLVNGTVAGRSAANRSAHGAGPALVVAMATVRVTRELRRK